MKKNVAGQKIGAQMVSATDGSAFTGAVTIYVTGDAGTQGAGSVGSGACAHEGNGYHTYTPDQAETNYDLIAFTFIGAGAVPVTIQVFTDFPQTEANQDLILAAIEALPTPGDATAATQALIRADIAALPTGAEVADKFLGRNLAGGSDGGRTVQDALRFNRNKVVVDLVTKTIVVYEEDDTTIAWQGMLSTSAIAQHIVGVDPA